MPEKQSRRIDKNMLVRSEQGLKAVLGLAVGGLIAFLIWFLLTRPAMQASRDNEQQIEKLNQQLTTERAILDRADEIKQNHRQVGTTLDEIIERQMVPSHASLGWVSIVLQEAAEADGVEITERSGDFTAPRQVRSLDAAPFILEHFNVNFTMRGGYHQFGRFLAHLEKKYPYAILQNISITSVSRESTMLNAVVSYNFPRFTEAGFPPEQRPQASEYLKPTAP